MLNIFILKYNTFYLKMKLVCILIGFYFFIVIKKKSPKRRKTKQKDIMCKKDGRLKAIGQNNL